MNQSTKLVVGVIVVVAVVAVGYFVSKGPSGPVSTEPIKIGVILPLTGKASNIGEDIKRALEIAKEEINTDAERKIELFYQDDETDAKKAVSAYYFLRNTEAIKIIIAGAGSPSTLAIAPLAEKDKVILITPVSSAVTISEAGDFIFRNHTSDKSEIEKLAPYAISKYKKVAIVYDKTNDTFLLNRKFFTEMFSQRGGTIVADIPIIGGSGDYKTDLLKLKPQLGNIEAVFVITLTKDGVTIVKQMQQLGIVKPILAVKSFGTTDFVKNVGNELAEGVVYAEAAYDETTNPEFWNKYLEKTGKKPSIWAPQSYDTLKILSLIFKTCKTDDTICIKDELYKIDYSGAAGRVLFDKNGDAIKEMAIKQIQSGNFVSKGPSGPVSTAPIKIGFVGPLSGEGASFGETEKNATELALQDISANPKSPKFEVVYEDGKCNGKDATSAIQKLISVDKVKIILGGACSAETLAMAPIAEQNKVLMLSAFSSNPAITNAGDYIFRNSPKDTDVAYLDADTITKLYKKVALISENTDYSQGVREVMKKVFSEKGVTVVADELYTGSQMVDFRSLLSKIKSAGPEILYVNPGTSAKAGGIIVKQSRELGITIPIHGNFSLGTPDALSTGGKFMNDVVISDSSGLAGKGKDVLASYKSKFGKDPANDFEMAAAYDRVLIIRDAIVKVGYDIEKIKSYLYELQNFSGVIGDYHFDKNGDVVGVGFMNVVLKDGEKLPYSPKQ